MIRLFKGLKKKTKASLAGQTLAPSDSSSAQQNDGRLQVSMENPMFYEFHGNQNVHNTHYHGSTGSTILDRLAGYAMLGATFDSSARDPPPRCHPGTRHDILRLIQKRLSDLDRKGDVSWLEGAAGVGKSAIMQTIAETEAERNTLSVSIFFSRPNNRDDPIKVFPTIAFQLATKLPSYQEYLAKRMASDPSFLDKTVEKQFKDLVVVPFAEKQLLGDHRGCVILIDGLDECKGTQEQRRILKLIGDFVSEHHTVPLWWVIASRPEQHLLDAFSDIKALLRDSFWRKEIPIDSEESIRDVELYLHNEFTRIRDHYHDLMTIYDKWPSEKQFLIISGAASGLFVFAATIIRFIDNDENPVHRLNIVVSVIEKQMKQRSVRINPLALLDVLYERILSDISSDTLDIVKLVLGYLIINRSILANVIHREPFWACNILDLEQHSLYGALRKLRSVLTFPEPARASEDDIRFYHTSFPDFLVEQERSHVYSVNLNETATRLWHRCMTILQQWTSNGDEGIELVWSVENLAKVSKRKRLTVDKTELVNFARASWPTLLERHFEEDLPTFYLLQPKEDLVEQLRELDFSHYETLESSAVNVDRLITCLEAQLSSHCNTLVREIPLASLDRKCFLRSMYERWWIDGWLEWLDGGNQIEPLGSKPKQVSGNDLKKIEEFLRANSGVRRILDLMDSVDELGIVVKVLGAPLKCRVWLRDTRQYASVYFPYIA